MAQERLSISSKPFEEIRTQFDNILNHLFLQMEDSGSDEGKITLTVEVFTHEEHISDEEFSPVPVTVPSLKYKVASEVKHKFDFSNRYPTNTALIHDGSTFRLLPLDTGDQQKLF